MQLTVKRKCFVSKRRVQVAATGSLYIDEVGLSMCVISHVHPGQPSGTHNHRVI